MLTNGAGCTVDMPLLQVQLGGLGQKAFTYKAAATAREAVATYGNGDLTTLQELEEQHKIRLAINSSPPSGPLDVDGVGLIEWQVALYGGGKNEDGAINVLKFIHHVLEYKVQQGQLREAPPLQVFVCPGLRKMSTTPPRPWVVASSADARVVPKPFAAAPPRGRRHVVIQLERKTKPQAPAGCRRKTIQSIETMFATLNLPMMTRPRPKWRRSFLMPCWTFPCTLWIWWGPMTQSLSGCLE